MAYEFDNADDFLNLEEFAEVITYSQDGVGKKITAILLEQEILGEGDGIDRVFSASAGHYATCYVKKADILRPAYTKDTVTGADGLVWRVKNNALSNGKFWQLSLERNQRLRS